MELIAGQFQSQGQKISQRRIHLQNLRGHPNGSSWLVKIRADFGSAQNIQLLHGFFARTELLALTSVDSLVLVGRKRDRGKTRLSSVEGSSSVHWKLVSKISIKSYFMRSCFLSVFSSSEVLGKNVSIRSKLPTVGKKRQEGVKSTCFMSKATSVPQTNQSQYSSPVEALKLIVEPKFLPVELDNSTIELHVQSRRKKSLQSYCSVDFVRQSIPAVPMTPPPGLTPGHQHFF